MLKILIPFILCAVSATSQAQSLPNESLGGAAACTTFSLAVLGQPYDAALMADAAARTLVVRIIEKDGQHYPTTMDFRPDRINLELKGGKVARATCG